MADVTYGLASGALNTTTGNQTFTDSNFGGGTPKAAILMVTSATVDGTMADHKRWSMGFVDGTIEGCGYGFSQHNVGTSQAERSGSTTKCIALTDTSDSTLDFAATFVSFGTNNITINITNAPTSAYILSVVLFGGADLKAQVDSVALSSTVNTGTTVTTTGMQADVVLMMYNDDDLDEVTNNVCDRISFGAGVDDGSLTQKCHQHESEDNRSTSATNMIFSTNRIGYSNGGGESIELTNISSGSYQVTTRDSGIGENCLCLALDLGGASFALAEYNTPTSTGVDTITTTWEPGLVLMGLTNVPTASKDTVLTGTNSGSTGYAALGENGSRTTSVYDEDNVSTTDTSSYTNTGTVVIFDENAGSAINQATPALNASDFTLNFSTADATSRAWWYLAFEKGDGGTGSTEKSNPLHGPIGGPLAGPIG